MPSAVSGPRAKVKPKVMCKNLKSRVKGFNPINEDDFNHGSTGASASPAALPERPPIRIRKISTQILPLLLTLLTMYYTHIKKDYL